MARGQYIGFIEDPNGNRTEFHWKDEEPISGESAVPTRERRQKPLPIVETDVKPEEKPIARVIVVNKEVPTQGCQGFFGRIDEDKFYSNEQSSIWWNNYRKQLKEGRYI